MTVTLKTMYPPQVETFMPSFCYNSPAKIWFNISSYNEDISNLIQYLHVSMVDQRNNVNVFAGNGIYPQYYPVIFNWEKNNNNDPNNKMGYDPDKKMYWVVIPPQLLKTKPYYNTNQYYKIQLRFDLTGSVGFQPNVYSNPTDFFKIDGSIITADALGLASYTNYNENNFTEWSTGTLVKPIFIPELNITSITNAYQSTDIPITGNLIFKDSQQKNQNDKTEWLSWYQIKILNENTEYFNSGKIYTDIQNHQINYKLDTSLLPFGEYQIQILYETNNAYLGVQDYSIQIKEYDNKNISIKYSIISNEDDGAITLNINELNYDQEDSNGHLIIRRSSYKSNFEHWDLIHDSIVPAPFLEESDEEINIVDKTIESMVGYKYQLQYIKDEIIYPPERTDIVHCDFYGGLFSDGDKVLKLTFDFQLSNRANAVNRAKTDTLGGQYPVFTQNSKLKYHTYSISGRISSEDSGELFLPKEEIFGEEYYNYRYSNNNIIDTSIFNGKSGSSTPIERIQPNNDWLYEREYRDTVEEWLNNGKPKLFRSMTEGNMIVILDGISMTPENALGRRLYNFSATMYEIGDGKDLNSIISLGLFDIN